MSKKLCENCLTVSESVRSKQIGGDKGSQRDPYWESLDLCQACGDALEGHDLLTFNKRYKHDRRYADVQ